MTRALERLLRLQRGDLAARPAALRLPAAGDRRVRRRAGRPRRALPRPLRRLAAAVRRRVAVPGGGGRGGRLRARRPATRPRPPARPAASSCSALAGLAVRGASRAGAAPGWLYPVVYVWVGIFGVLAPAQVWTLANYVLTPREARRLFGFVGAGATLGATVGGFALERPRAPLRRREPARAGRPPCCCSRPPGRAALWRRGPRALRRARPSGRAARASLRGSLRLVLASAHLRTIAGIVLLSSFVTALAGWQFKAIAQQAFPAARTPWRVLLRHVQRLGRRAVPRDAAAVHGGHPAPARARLGAAPPAARPARRLARAAGLRDARRGGAPARRRQGAALLDRPAGGGAALPAGAAGGEAAREVVHRHRGVAGRRRPRRARGARASRRSAASAPVPLTLVNLPLVGAVAGARHARAPRATSRRSRRRCSSTGSTPSAPTRRCSTATPTELLASRLDAVGPAGDPLRARPDGARPHGDGRPPGGARPARPPRRGGARAARCAS